MVPRSPPGALDHRTSTLFAGQWILLADLGRGIATTEIGDALVAAEQVGAIKKQFRGDSPAAWASSQRFSTSRDAGGAT
jgi:hypothetical protein